MNNILVWIGLELGSLNKISSSSFINIRKGDIKKTLNRWSVNLLIKINNEWIFYTFNMIFYTFIIRIALEITTKDVLPLVYIIIKKLTSH